jgi:hypothetical protein
VCSFRALAKTPVRAVATVSTVATVDPSSASDVAGILMVAGINVTMAWLEEEARREDFEELSDEEEDAGGLLECMCAATPSGRSTTPK